MVWRSVRVRCGVAVSVLAMAGGGLLPVGVFPAMAAPAPPTVTIVKEGPRYGNIQIAEATVSCPSGSRLTGGGGQVVKEDPHFEQLQPRYAADGTSSWYVYAQQVPDVVGGLEVWASAVCVTSGPATQLVTAKGTGQGRVSVTVPCPEGTHVLGGGATLTKGGGGVDTGYLASSFPGSDLRSWNVAAAVPVTSSVTGYAICAQPGPATQIVTSTFTSNINNNTWLEATATCPEGTHITGGGGDGRGGYLEWTRPVYYHGYDPHINADRDFDEWHVKMRIKFPNIASLVTYTICESDTW